MRGHASTDRLHQADDLVTGYDGYRRIRELSVDQVEIGATDPACENLDEHVGWSWRRLFNLDWHYMSEARSAQRHRSHCDLQPFHVDALHPIAAV